MTTDLLQPSPTPDQVRTARVAANLSQLGAAQASGVKHQPRWAEYENGKHAMDPARWTLFLLATGQHPVFRIIVK